VIDISLEQPLALAVAVKLIPPGRNGKRCHLSTLLRWIMRGSKAPDGAIVRLEAIRLGGRWLTSREAIQRFAEKLTPHMGVEAPTPLRSKMARTHASERAAVELARRGV
jgi:Protein of unknown function (DUF1580)